MEKIVFLNSGKVDFDKGLDFSSIAALGTFTHYKESNQEEILTRVEGYQVVITKELPMDGALIRSLPPSVKLICEAGTGYNNIDLDAAKEKGVLVCNIPGYSTGAVAQLAMTMVLNLASSMAHQQRMIQQNDYTNFTRHLQVPHFEVEGKTLGIIGSGSIGQQVIKTARALGMKILANSRRPRVYEDPDIQWVSLEDLLKNSDFVSIHCPLTQETRHLIDQEKLSLMKPTAFIINTSRGPIIKETDLIKALQQGIIAGAGLDVQDPEPPETNNPMFQMKNVILTPHIGWKCFESRQRLIELVAGNIAGFLKGAPINVVK